MRGKILVVLSVFLLVIMMGCIQIETYHKQNADGSAVITQKIDMSEYIDYMNSMQDSYGTENGEEELIDSFEEMCNDVPSGVTCTADSETWVVTMTMSVSAQDAFYTFDSSGSKYVLTIDEMPYFGDQSDETGGIPTGSLTDPENGESAAQLQSYGMEWTYVVEMPGKITSAPRGEIDKDNPNKVTFDILEMMDDQEKIVVEAEKGGIPCLPAFLALFVVIGAFVIKR